MKKDFNNLILTLKNSIKTWDYFVNWKKVFSNSSELEIILNKLNYLLGKQNLKDEFIKLYSSNPDIIRALPVLLAVRENELEIFDSQNKVSEQFKFNNNENTPGEYFGFIEKSGLYKLFKEDGIKNLVDYVIGVEVGLESHGRKNRGGKLMEKVVGVFIEDFCKKNKFEYLSQANAKKVKEKWNFDIFVNKSSRSFDFAIRNPKTGSVKLIETNFFNGGGSKLKTVSAEFRTLFNELQVQNIEFIWITDGYGWKSAHKPLEETYEHNDYVFNLDMLTKGALDNIDW